MIGIGSRVAFPEWNSLWISSAKTWRDEGGYATRKFRCLRMNKPVSGGVLSFFGLERNLSLFRA